MAASSSNSSMQSSTRSWNSVSPTRSQSSTGSRNTVSPTRSRSSTGSRNTVSPTRTRPSTGSRNTVSPTRSRPSTGSRNTVSPTRSRSSTGLGNTASRTTSRSSTQGHVNPSGFEPDPSKCLPAWGGLDKLGRAIASARYEREKNIPQRAKPSKSGHWRRNLGPKVPAGYVVPPIPPVAFPPSLYGSSGWVFRPAPNLKNLPEAYPPLQSGYSPASSKLRPEVSAGNEGRTIPPRAYPPPPYGSGGSFSRPQSDDPIKVSKLNAFNKLVENVLGDVTQVDEMFNTQAELRQNKKKGLEQQLQRISKNTDELEALLREVKKLRTRNLESVGVDAFSKQVLECIVSDLAIDDVIYLLDKAVEEGAIPFDQYLKSVRRLSRKQFYHRATATKVGASQMQAQAPLLNHQHRMI